eukprot:396964-Rhodomonas_salina.3
MPVPAWSSQTPSSLSCSESDHRDHPPPRRCASDQPTEDPGLSGSGWEVPVAVNAQQSEGSFMSVKPAGQLRSATLNSHSASVSPADIHMRDGTAAGVGLGDPRDPRTRGSGLAGDHADEALPAPVHTLHTLHVGHGGRVEGQGAADTKGRRIGEHRKSSVTGSDLVLVSTGRAPGGQSEVPREPLTLSAHLADYTCVIEEDHRKDLVKP